MNYSIKPSDDGDYIILKVYADFNGIDMSKYIKELHAVGKELGINRYLGDVREARNLDTVADNYEFAYTGIKEGGIDLFAKVAILASPGDHSHDFVETVLVNAGQKVMLFYSLDEALEYLGEE
jgi:hypothetical protein